MPETDKKPEGWPVFKVTTPATGNTFLVEFRGHCTITQKVSGDLDAPVGQPQVYDNENLQAIFTIVSQRDPFAPDAPVKPEQPPPDSPQ